MSSRAMVKRPRTIYALPCITALNFCRLNPNSRTFSAPFLAHGNYMGHKFCNANFFKYGLPIPSIGRTIRTFPRQYFRRTEVIIGKFWNEYGFVGCTNKKDFSFKACHKPFQAYLWVALILFSIFLTGLGIVFGYADSAVMLLLEIVLEQSVEVGRELALSIPFRWILTPTIFTGIILVNAYKSLVITNMLVPTPLPDLKTFRDALDAKAKFFPNNLDWKQYVPKTLRGGLGSTPAEEDIILDQVQLYLRNVSIDFLQNLNCSKKYFTEAVSTFRMRV